MELGLKFKIMKKKVLSLLAVILFMSSISAKAINMNIVEDNDSATCFEYADRWATIVGFWNSLSHYDEYLVFESLYDDCMSQ